MLFWHAGGAVLLFRLLFRDPRGDLRFVALGAVLPNLVDGPAVWVLRGDPEGVGRPYGHTLLFAVAVLALAMLTTRRGSRRRGQATAGAAGVMFHLLLDGVWMAPGLLLWPMSGRELAVLEGGWTGWTGAILAEPGRLLKEAAGLLYLGWLGHRAGLTDRERRSRFWRTGTVTT